MYTNERMPLVSVILASYNHEKFIGEAIDSIMEQTYPYFELIISDDGSTDDSQKIIAERKKKYNDDPRIICLLAEENTLFSILEKAFSIAKGKYICVMGGDDKAFSQKLEKQVEVLESDNKCAACFTWVECIGDNEKRINELNNLYNRENLPHDELLKSMILFGNYLNAPSAMMRLDLFRLYGGMNFNYRQTQDYRLWLKCILNHNVHVIQGKLTYYRVVSGSLSDYSADMGVLSRASLEKIEILCEVMNMIDSSSVKALYKTDLDIHTDLDVKCLVIKFLLENCNDSTEIITAALRLFFQYHERTGFSQLLREKYGIDRRRISELVTDKSMHSVSVYQANNLKILYRANLMKRIAIDRLEKSDQSLIEEMLDCIDAGKGTISLDHIIALYNYCYSNEKNEDDFVGVLAELGNKGVHLWE